MPPLKLPVPDKRVVVVANELRKVAIQIQDSLSEINTVTTMIDSLSMETQQSLQTVLERIGATNRETQSIAAIKTATLKTYHVGLYLRMDSQSNSLWELIP